MILKEGRLDFKFGKLSRKGDGCYISVLGNESETGFQFWGFRFGISVLGNESEMGFGKRTHPLEGGPWFLLLFSSREEHHRL